MDSKSLSTKILGIVGIIFIVAVIYWLFIGTGMSFGRGNIFCAQVITEARNPISRVVREFPTPCKVPIGWEAVR